MSRTAWQGQAAMRISVINWSTNEGDVDASATAILRALHSERTERTRVHVSSRASPPRCAIAPVAKEWTDEIRDRG
jgi:hypothetical protein